MKRLILFIILSIVFSVQAQKKISEYPNTATAAGTDLFILARPSTTTNYNIRYNQLASQIITNIATNLTAGYIPVVGSNLQLSNSIALQTGTNWTLSGSLTTGPHTNATVGAYANYQSSATGTNYFAGPVGVGHIPLAKLDVNGGVNIGATAFDPGANNLFVQGNAGFGTNTPQARIHVGAIGATTAAEGIQFGDDVNLYRSAANIIKTPDTIEALNVTLSGLLYATGYLKTSSGLAGGTVSDGTFFPPSTSRGFIAKRNLSDDYPVFQIYQDMATATGDLQQWFTDVGALGTVAVVNSNGYFGLGLTTTTNRLAVNGMTYHTNVTASAGDPVNGTLQWATGGEWQYRNSAADSGAGQINRVHNRAAQVVGVGTDYSLTQTKTNVTFGTSGGSIALPTAGTYQLHCLANFASTTAADDLEFYLWDSTNNVVVPGSWQHHESHANNDHDVTPLTAIYTVTTNVHIWLGAVNVTAARGVIVSTNTILTYVRCY